MAYYCMQRIKDRSNRDMFFELRNNNGDIFYEYPEKIEYMIKEGSIVNLTLAKGNRILFTDRRNKLVSYIDVSLMHHIYLNVMNNNHLTLLFRPNVGNVKQYLAKLKLLNNNAIVYYEFLKSNLLYLETVNTAEIIANGQIKFRDSDLSETLSASWRNPRLMGYFEEVTIQNIDLRNVDTSEMTVMDNMFKHCYTKHIDLSTLNTSNVTSMKNMFSYFGDNLFNYRTDLDLRHFNTKKVKDMSFMFSRSKIDNVLLDSIDLRSLVSISCMFSHSIIDNLSMQNVYIPKNIMLNEVFDCMPDSCNVVLSDARLIKAYKGRKQRKTNG